MPTRAYRSGLCPASQPLFHLSSPILTYAAVTLSLSLSLSAWSSSFPCRGLCTCGSRCFPTYLWRAVPSLLRLQLKCHLHGSWLCWLFWLKASSMPSPSLCHWKPHDLTLSSSSHLSEYDINLFISNVFSLIPLLESCLPKRSSFSGLFITVFLVLEQCLAHREDPQKIFLPD